MPKFRKKPVVVDAVQWNGSLESLREILAETTRSIAQVQDKKLVIGTLEGDMRANLGDWIIKGIKGEIYSCKPDIFDATYEGVEE